MESVLKFLERDDSKWAMDFDRYDNFIHVPEVFGYEFETQKTTHEVQSFLKVDFPE